MCHEEFWTKFAAMMGYKLQSFKITRALSRVVGTRNSHGGKLPIFSDEDNEELEHDVRSFVDKTTHLTSAVLRRDVEMSLL